MLDGMESLGVVMLPCYLYMLYKRWFLNENQLMLLLTCCFMLVGLAIRGWQCTLVYLIGYGYHNLIVLQSARCTQLFHRGSSLQFSGLTNRLFMISQNEIKLVLYLVYFWILVRILSLKSLSFDMGGGTFVSLMGGWNCTLSDFWFLNSLWLILLIFAALACWFLILYDRESQTLYKYYLLKYKISIDLIVNIFVVAYHYQIYIDSDSLQDCLIQYQNRSWVRLIWFWGFPFSNLWFFWWKQGVFEEGGSAKTEGESELEKEMNQMIINREFELSGVARPQD